MKKYLYLSLIALLAVAVLAGPLMAEDDKAPAKRQGRRGPRAGRPGPQRGPGMGPVAQALKDAKLSEEQHAEVKKIMKAHHEAAMASMKELAPKLKALREKFVAAMKEKNKEAIEALRKEREALMAGRKALQAKLIKDLSGVLNEQQLAAVKAAFEKVGGPRRGRPGGPAPMRALARLDLTKEQKDQIQTLTKAAREAAAKAEGREAKRAVFEKLRKDIGAVLTDEQKAKLEEMRKNAPQRRPRRGPGGEGEGRGKGRPGPGGRGRGRGGNKPAETDKDNI